MARARSEKVFRRAEAGCGQEIVGIKALRQRTQRHSQRTPRKTSLRALRKPLRSLRSKVVCVSLLAACCLLPSRLTPSLTVGLLPRAFLQIQPVAPTTQPSPSPSAAPAPSPSPTPPPNL